MPPPEGISREKKNQIVELRLQGVSCTKIAEQLNLNPKTVYKWSARVNKIIGLKTGDIAQLSLVRLEKMINSFWKEATNGLNGKAAELVLKLIQAQCKLAGLDNQTTINQVNVANIAKDMTEPDVKEKIQMLTPLLMRKGYITIDQQQKEPPSNGNDESQS